MIGESKRTRVACLLTCHNRRDKTMYCLAALFACRLPEGVDLSVVLVDDGSTDGTTDAVRMQFPAVRILGGDGSLFWNGGMRLAFGTAMAERFDDYLWLNDDTVLDTDAFETLYACRLQLQVGDDRMPSIIVGATRDPHSGQLSYGGLVPRDARSPNYLVTLPMATVPQRCRTLNGNCVLIPSAVAEALGNLDVKFVHAIGDWDYGLRASAAGFAVWMAPGFVGTCEGNPPYKFPPHLARSVRARLRFVTSPKQVPPRAWYTYVKRNYGWTWPLEFAKPYASAVIRALQAKWRGGTV